MPTVYGPEGNKKATLWVTFLFNGGGGVLVYAAVQCVAPLCQGV